MSQFQTIIKREYSGLAWDFHVSPESCSNPEYFDEYIRMVSVGDYLKGVSTTHLIIDEDDTTHNKKIMGFVSLRATSFIEDSFSEDGSKIILGIPSLEIFELAVDKDYEGQGVGTDLIGIAFEKATEIRKDIGIQRVVLCAARESVGFYERKPHKFRPCLKIKYCTKGKIYIN